MSSFKNNETLQKVKETTERTIKKGIQKTRELKFYLIKFVFRLAVFLSILFLYVTRRNLLIDLMNRPFWQDITLVHIIWAIFMIIMCRHLLPNGKLSMAWKKAKESEYRPVDSYDELELLRFVQKQNQRAWTVMLVWLCFNAIFGILYLVDVLESGDMLMLTVFYFLCDYICILLYCPFQSKLMKNKCCINCRIYDWGHFMMFTPMLFVKNFFSWSLFFTSLVVLLCWEIRYAKYPERFWEGSNSTLKCANCKEKTCQIKTRLKNKK